MHPRLVSTTATTDPGNHVFDSIFIRSIYATISSLYILILYSSLFFAFPIQFASWSSSCIFGTHLPLRCHSTSVLADLGLGRSALDSFSLTAAF